jgi:N-acylneuraminate cytidylyltransferase
MINNKKVLGIIPARGGSKGVPQKNIRKLAGKPLIAWTIMEGKKSKYIDRLILSSDNEEIIETAKQCGCDVPFVRPSELAKDDTPGIEPILHALNTLPERYYFVVVLQPTSPLRRVNDIDYCLKLCVDTNSPSCVSITESDKNPYWMYTLEERGRLRAFLNGGEKYYRRQDFPKVYALNGAVYVAKTDWVKKNKKLVSSESIGYIMPKSRSFDIDTEIDFQICDIFLQPSTTISKEPSSDLSL